MNRSAQKPSWESTSAQYIRASSMPFAVPIVALVLASVFSAGCAGGSSAVSPGSLLNPIHPPAGGSPATFSAGEGSGGSSRYHIATLAYDDDGFQGENASAASVVRLVSYAEGGATNKAVRDCHSVKDGCKATFYFNYSHPLNDSEGCKAYPDSEFVGAASESWYLHDTGFSDSGHRVHGVSGSGCYIWSMNQNYSEVQSWWRNFLRTNGGSYDLFLVDNDAVTVADSNWFNSGGGCDPWPHMCQSTQEIRDDSAELASRINFVNAMTYSNGNPMYFIAQTLDANLNHLSDEVSLLKSTNRIVALSCENCIIGSSGPMPQYYEGVLDGMADINSTHGAYLLISVGKEPTGSSEQILDRLVTTAVVWLGYSEGHTIVQPDLEASSKNLAVWPEDLIYPSEPIQSMQTTSSDLQVSPGIWRREFKTCYQAGEVFGRCAAIVNSTANSVTVKASWLSQSYKHTITVSGGDVLSGGNASVTSASFTAGETTVRSGNVLLIAQ